MDQANQQILANKELWDKRTQAHLQSEFYDMKKFMDGASSLNRFELDLLGDVNNKSLLHLQCHFGQDTLSLARLGAKVTGIDFTPSAVDAASDLARQLGIDARFVCCNVYDTRLHISEKFDFVFTSYGTVGWLPDLKPWAKVVSESLVAGGKFVMVDFHPYVWMLDDDFRNLKYSYFNAEIIETDTTGSYAAGRGLHEPMKEYGWNHPLSDIVTSLLNEGLNLEIFQEYDGSPYNCFPGMEKHTDGLYRFTQWEKICH